MKTKLICAIALACAAIQLTAMPTEEETKRAEPVVKKLLAPERAALKSGRKTRSEVADAAMKLADETDTDAAKLLLMKGAFVLYVRDGKLEKAVETMSALETVISDMPPQSVTNMIEIALLGVSKKENGARLYKLLDEAKAGIPSHIEPKLTASSVKERSSVASILEGMIKLPGLDCWLSATELTQGQWESVMGNNPSSHKGANLPVENVSRDDCDVFLKKLNQTEEVQASQFEFRLPELEEWKYAAWAGSAGHGSWIKPGVAGDVLDMAWVEANSSNQTHAVAMKAPNAFGFYDMLGNVWEWLSRAGGDAPSGCGSLKGCAFDQVADKCTWNQNWHIPTTQRHCGVGLRLAAHIRFGAIANGYTWSYRVKNGEAMIVATNGLCAVSPSPKGDVSIPSTLDGVKVTSIGNNAFRNCRGLTSVTMPADVTSIGDSAFNSCCELNAVMIPSSVRNIGEWAFANCYGLKSMTIPLNVGRIGGGAFYRCRELTSVTMCGERPEAPNNIFLVCGKLKSIHVPANAKSWEGMKDWCGIPLVFDGTDDVPAHSTAEMNGVYCIIDISGGSNAEHYPISYLDEVPKYGWGDEYKTTKIVLRRVDAGTYPMLGGRQVTFTKPFYIGIFELTQKQVKLLSGDGDRKFVFEGDMRPADCLTWDEMRGKNEEFDYPKTKEVAPDSIIGRLRAKTGLFGIDLPTSYQFRCAWNAGTDGSGRDARLTGRHWSNQRDGKGGHTSTHTKVGSYLPNEWGIYDLHGNVWEMCLDRTGSPKVENEIDPMGPREGAKRQSLGGCWNSSERFVFSALVPQNKEANDQKGKHGCRIVINVETDKGAKLRRPQFKEQFEAERVAAPAQGMNVAAKKMQTCDFLLNKDFKKNAKYYLCLFSASWCPPCRAEMPRIAKAYAESLKDDPNIELIHFSRDQNDEKALAWAKEHDVKFPVVKPNGGNPLDLNTRGIPHLFIVKADGTLVEDGHPMKLFTDEKLRELKTANGSAGVRASATEKTEGAFALNAAPGSITELNLGNVPPLQFIYCPAGKFSMGYKEQPALSKVKDVEITSPFWVSKTPIRADQLESLGLDSITNTPYGAAVIKDASIVVQKLPSVLKERFGKMLPSGYVFRLPTEAEFEYLQKAETKDGDGQTNIWGVERLYSGGYIGLLDRAPAYGRGVDVVNRRSRAVMTDLNKVNYENQPDKDPVGWSEDPNWSVFRRGLARNCGGGKLITSQGGRFLYGFYFVVAPDVDKLNKFYWK